MASVYIEIKRVREEMNETEGKSGQYFRDGDRVFGENYVATNTQVSRNSDASDKYGRENLIAGQRQLISLSKGARDADDNRPGQ